MSPVVRQIGLAGLHRELGAKFGPFAGYDMPIQYPAGLKAEHLHTRSQAGLFDVSHMGQLHIRARDGTAQSLQTGLQAALPIDFTGWPIGMQKYSFLLNDAGGIEDDLMLVNLGDTVRMVVNAGNRDADRARLMALCPELSFDWVDAALIALQGPQAEAVLAQLDPSAAAMSFMQARELMLEGASCFTTRSGYTGEDGYEISLPCAAPLTPGDLSRLRAAFDEEHRKMFGHTAPNEPVEIVSYRLRGIGRVPPVELPEFERTGAPLSEALREMRPARFDGKTVECPVYQRERLDVGATFEGPAIIDQLDCTTVVPPGQSVRIDTYRNMIITIGAA